MLKALRRNHITPNPRPKSDYLVSANLQASDFEKNRDAIFRYPLETSLISGKRSTVLEFMLIYLKRNHMWLSETGFFNVRATVDQRRGAHHPSTAILETGLQNVVEYLEALCETLEAYLREFIGRYDVIGNSFALWESVIAFEAMPDSVFERLLVADMLWLYPISPEICRAAPGLAGKRLRFLVAESSRGRKRLVTSIPHNCSSWSFGFPVTSNQSREALFTVESVLAMCAAHLLPRQFKGNRECEGRVPPCGIDTQGVRHVSLWAIKQRVSSLLTGDCTRSKSRL